MPSDGLLAASSRADQVGKIKNRYRSDEELHLRDMVERWGRAKWPDARIVHELVMGRGEVRCDVALVTPNHIVAVEIKSSHDNVGRLLTQAGTYRLAVPELWIVCADRHVRDANLVRYLMPSIGVAVPDTIRDGAMLWRDRDLVELDPAGPFVPHPEAMLSLLWVEELYAEATRAGVYQSGRKTRPSHAALVERMKAFPADEITAAVCRQLRGREALWRADSPVVAS